LNEKHENHYFVYSIIPLFLCSDNPYSFFLPLFTQREFAEHPSLRKTYLQEKKKKGKQRVEIRQTCTAFDLFLSLSLSLPPSFHPLL